MLINPKQNLGSVEWTAFIDIVITKKCEFLCILNVKCAFTSYQVRFCTRRLTDSIILAMLHVCCVQGSFGGFGTWILSSLRFCTVSWLWSAPTSWLLPTRMSSLFSNISKNIYLTLCSLVHSILYYKSRLVWAFLFQFLQGGPEAWGCSFQRGHKEVVWSRQP